MPVHPVVELDDVEVERAQRVGHLVAVLASGHEVGDEAVARARQGIREDVEGAGGRGPVRGVQADRVGARTPMPSDTRFRPTVTASSDRRTITPRWDTTTETRCATEESTRITTSSPGRCDVRSGRASRVTGGTPGRPRECGLGMRSAARGRRSPSRPGGAGRTPAREVRRAGDGGLDGEPLDVLDLGHEAELVERRR